jgi:hypothetical protein
MLLEWPPKRCGLDYILKRPTEINVSIHQGTLELSERLIGLVDSLYGCNPDLLDQLLNVYVFALLSIGTNRF